MIDFKKYCFNIFSLKLVIVITIVFVCLFGVALYTKAALQCPQHFEYITTLGSTVHWDASGNVSGSATSCPGAPGWNLVGETCLISNGNSCESDVCLWNRPASNNFAYYLTHAGTDYYRSPIDCSYNPPTGYTLKSRGCAATGVYGCITDVCLWQGTGSSSTSDSFVINHAGGNLYDNVNCQNDVPGGYTINSRIPILSYSTNVYSDLCLWQRSQQCATVTCSTNSECGTNGLTGSPFCQSGNVYQNYKTYTCNNPGTSSSTCSNSTAAQLQQTCTGNQTCLNGSCNNNIVTTCSQSTSPLKNLSGLSTITIYEKTDSVNTLPFLPSSYTFAYGTNDFNTSAAEHYDFYYSDADGTPNINGAYISSSMHRDLSYPDGQSGNNIDAMKLSFSDGHSNYADLVSSFQLGNSITSVYNGSPQAALGAPDNISTAMGDQNSRITIGFCAAFVNVTCSTNSQCGTNGLTGNSFCQSNGVYQNYKTYTCNNPGTANSNCSDSTAPQLQNNCTGNQTCLNGSCSNSNITCSTNSQCGTNGLSGSPFCQGNGVYQNYNTYTCNNPGTSNSNCSNSTTPQLSQTCSYGQTCSNGSCITNNTCTNHSYQRCVGNSVYWFDSCGTQQDLSQTCSYNQTCSNNSCVGTTQNQNQKSLLVTVRNLSSGNLNWSNSVNASPSDVVQFSVVIASSSAQNITNLSVKDTLPTNLIYNNNLTLDGIPNSGNIISTMYIDNISPGQTRTITYQAQVAPVQNFSFGTTTLSDSVVVGDPITGSASVIVTRGGVLGASAVSTGLTNNFLVDSFFLPLIIALLGIWLYRSGMFGIVDWFDSKKLKHKDRIGQRQLQSRIAQIRKREIVK